MKREPFDPYLSVHAPPPPTFQAARTESFGRKVRIKRFVDLVGCTHALSSHPLMMHRPGEIEHDARHGGSNGCPTWPVADRHFER